MIEDVCITMTALTNWFFALVGFIIGWFVMDCYYKLKGQ